MFVMLIVKIFPTPNKKFSDNIGAADEFEV